MKLAEMALEQAASKGLETILRSWYADNPNEGVADTSFESWVTSQYGDRWSREEIEIDKLEEYNSIWQEVKYEAGVDTEHVAEGFSAKVAAEYGGEGQGDQFWVVISVSDGETVRFFRRDGWYSSYGDGGELDGPTSEVRPAEKTVVVYE